MRETEKGRQRVKDRKKEVEKDRETEREGELKTPYVPPLPASLLQCFGKERHKKNKIKP